MPYFSGVQLSISCLKYMEVVNMDVLFCYLVTTFLISFCLTLFGHNLFLIKSDFLFWKERFKWKLCFFHDGMSLMQFYMNHLEKISELFEVSKFSTFFFCKQIILCLSACFQDFATIFIDTFSSCMPSFKEINCFI